MNALHGASDGGHDDKGAKTSNKENSGVSDMFIRTMKCLNNIIFKEHSFLQGISIHEAARQGDLDTVQHLIDEGMDVNFKDDDGVGIWTGLLEF